jgi:transposase InsO family protein
MVVLDQFTRRIIGFGVQSIAVDGPVLCRMFNSAIAGSGIPKRVSTDNDPLFEFHRWKANLRILEIDEIKSVPFVPVSHPFIERLIGTIRPEYLDQTMFWGQRDLERKLAVFRNYYNRERVHSSLDGKTPKEHAGGQALDRADINHFAWRSTCDGLVELPKAA